MHTTIEMLDEIKRRAGGISDYALAKQLRVTRGTLSFYRTGRGFPGPETALLIAEILNLDPGYVLAIIESERAASEPVRRAWRKIAEQLAAVVLAIGILASPPAPAAPQVQSGQCALCKHLRRAGYHRLLRELLLLLAHFVLPLSHTWKPLRNA